MLPEFLVLGGLMIWVILVASTVAIVVFIERVLHYHRAQINSMEFLNGVRNVLKRDNVVEAISICDATPGPVARLVKVAIVSRDKGHERMREALEEAGLIDPEMLIENAPRSSNLRILLEIKSNAFFITHRSTAPIRL